MGGNQHRCAAYADQHGGTVCWSQKQYLERYLLDGRLEISNKRTERSIKLFVIDRKNFLLANTPRDFYTGVLQSRKFDKKGFRSELK